ncbi:hypothetical protein CRG98_020755 [Punica granatum]|uniref:Uncharacterized protein n=1 Tax=Punica granatum TaxID=22663 RepID=A0A2I0JTR8_PUNGR|nr:hypothetical protein CRG98_020755 [Punica granatum]
MEPRLMARLGLPAPSLLIGVAGALCNLDFVQTNIKFDIGEGNQIGAELLFWPPVPPSEIINGSDAADNLTNSEGKRGKAQIESKRTETGMEAPTISPN